MSKVHENGRRSNYNLRVDSRRYLLKGTLPTIFDYFYAPVAQLDRVSLS